MPTRSLRCCVELNLRSVSCPGVWLHSREDVYIRVTLFGQIRTTRRVSPIFPLLFCETFQFDKVFYGAHDPSQVADDLLCDNIQLELLQDSVTSVCGRRLAVYIRNAADFLYPDSTGFPRCCGCKDRDILMERSFDFPGISPKLEFSTTTSIKEAFSPYVDADLWRNGRSARTSRSMTRRSRPRSRSATRKGKYGQATISSISRSRSVSPRWCPKLDYDCDYLVDRPPFVVRKAEFQKLVGRVPGSKKHKSKYAKKMRRGRSCSPRPRSRCTADCIHCDGLFPESQCTLCRVYRRYTGQPYSYHFAPGCCCFNSKVIREPGSDPKPVFESDCDSDDFEVASYRSRRSPSPTRLYGSTYAKACLHDNDLDSLDELAIDLQRARNRSTALERKSGKKRSKSRRLTFAANRVTETDLRARMQLL